MIPPPLGQFGNMGRNTLRDSGFKNFDLSIAKNWHFSERFRMQFRAEFFTFSTIPTSPIRTVARTASDRTILRRALSDASVLRRCCRANPVIGSGGSRAVQLGLKFIF